MSFSLIFRSVRSSLLIPRASPYRRSVGMAAQAQADAVEDVTIDKGVFKYVLIKLYYGKEQEKFKHIVRGNREAEFHADVYEDVYARVKGLGCDTECIGGGRINHDPAKKTIKIYGYSQGYGLADHSITSELIKKKYPDYEVTWSNDGY